MQALLDTHAFLWWNTDDKMLSSTAREFIGNTDNIIFFSVISAWEIVIKFNLEKLPLPESPKLYISSRISYYEFQTIDVKMLSAIQLLELENHHKDPFDRLLIAQSKVENLPIITFDKNISLYDVDIIW